MDEYKRRRRRSRAVMSMFLDSIGGVIDNVDVATFDSDGNDLKALIVGIELVQSGTGDPSPDNVRPITGHSSVNVIVSPTLNPLDGTITNIPLGGTYYGGQLDVLTGVLTIDRVLDSITKDSAWYSFSTGTGNSSAVVQLTEYQNCQYNSGNTNRNGAISSTGKEAQNYWVGARQNEALTDGDMCFAYSSSGQLRFHRTDVANITDLASFKANFPDTQIAYYLSTPTTVQLTGQQIATFLGTNNVWCSSGQIIHLEY